MIEQVIDALVANKTIKEEEKELYSFGLRQGLIMLAQTIIVLLIGILLGMWWQSILFMLSYIPLRLSAGGVHANKQWVCFICTAIHFIAVMMLIKHIDWSSLAIIILSIVSGVIIYFIAPVEDKNKPFEEIEKKVYTKRARITLVIEAIIISVMLALSLTQFAVCVSITVGTLAVMVIIGSIKNAVLNKQINKTLQGVSHQQTRENQSHFNR